MAYASMKDAYASWKKHTLAWSGLGYWALVRVLGLFQTFFSGSLFEVVFYRQDSITIGPGIPDFGRYKMGCLHLATHVVNRVDALHEAPFLVFLAVFWNFLTYLGCFFSFSHFLIFILGVHCRSFSLSLVSFFLSLALFFVLHYFFFVILDSLSPLF